MDLYHHRPYDTQVTRAMLASDRLVLDLFCAERTLHIFRSGSCARGYYLARFARVEVHQEGPRAFSTARLVRLSGYPVLRYRVSMRCKPADPRRFLIGNRNKSLVLRD